MKTSNSAWCKKEKKKGLTEILKVLTKDFTSYKISYKSWRKGK